MLENEICCSASADLVQKVLGTNRGGASAVPPSSAVTRIRRRDGGTGYISSSASVFNHAPPLNGDSASGQRGRSAVRECVMTGLFNNHRPEAATVHQPSDTDCLRMVS